MKQLFFLSWASTNKWSLFRLTGRFSLTTFLGYIISKKVKYTKWGSINCLLICFWLVSKTKYIFFLSVESVTLQTKDSYRRRDKGREFFVFFLTVNKYYSILSPQVRYCLLCNFLPGAAIEESLWMLIKRICIESHNERRSTNTCHTWTDLHLWSRHQEVLIERMDSTPALPSLTKRLLKTWVRVNLPLEVTRQVQSNRREVEGYVSEL